MSKGLETNYNKCRFGPNVATHAAEQSSKTYSRAVMIASGADRFSINNRLEVLYLVCITWMVRGTVTAN